jgi:pimeloyl-ACP methyl ester carboxylesterase
MAVAMQLSMTLPDGRRLGYAEAGPPDGRPLLYFHGIPGSRLEPPPETELLGAMGIRLIALERPGYGGSTPQPARRLIDWPADVAAFADRLALGAFAVLGFSGGRIAAAGSYPGRVTSCCSLYGGPSLPTLSAGRSHPNALRDEPWTPRSRCRHHGSPSSPTSTALGTR